MLGPRPYAALCRRTCLELLNDGPHWGPLELEMWLVAAATELPAVDLSIELALRAAWTAGPWADAMRGLLGRARREPRLLGPLLAPVREEITTALAEVARPDEAPRWVVRSLCARHVVRVCDEQRRIRFVPTSRPHRIVDWLFSLLTIDFLVRPEAYGAPMICSACGRLELGATHCTEPSCVATREGVMDMHEPASCR